MATWAKLQDWVGLGRKAKEALHEEDSVWLEAIEELKNEAVRSLSDPMVERDETTKNLLVLKLQIYQALPKRLEQMVARGKKAKLELERRA